MQEDNIFDMYEKYKPEEPVVIEEDDKLFEIEESHNDEPKPQTFSGIDEDALIEKLSAKILEKLSINKNEEE